MKKNGFISSALLYGMLALFLVVTMGTLAVLGNRKLAMDKMKEQALLKIQTPYAERQDIVALYDSDQPFRGNIWYDLTGNNHHGNKSGGITYDNNERSISFANGAITANVADANYSSDNGITISTVIRVPSKNSGNEVIGLWNLNGGIFANIGPMPSLSESSNRIDAVNFCYDNSEYHKLRSNDERPFGSTMPTSQRPNPECVSVNMNDDFIFGKYIQLTVTMISGKNITVYINGKMVGHTEPKHGMQFSQASQTLTIGQNPFDTARTNIYTENGNEQAVALQPVSFSGNMHNFIVYKKAISASDDENNYEINKVLYRLES